MVLTSKEIIEKVKGIIGENTDDASLKFLEDLTDTLKAVYSIGQDLGGSIRRIATGKTCPL